MRGKYFLLCYLLVKLMALVCKADGEPGGFIVMATSNGSIEEESVTPETPHTEDECKGYFDVMGQWDPPFNCSTAEYLYCCGTCGFRFCCTYRRARLDQSNCKNNRTMEWMKTMNPPMKKKDPRHDPTRDKTNMVVYVICGVVAIMALVGIFTKLGLEKAHRPQRENMSRAVASVLQGGCPGGQFQGEDALGMHAQHYDARAINQGGQINNNMAPGSTLGGPHHPYPALAQLAHAYEQQQSKELSKYASLKAVAAKANGDYYSKRRLLVELPAKGGLPLQPLQPMRAINSPMTSNMTANMTSSMKPTMTSNMTSNMTSAMASAMTTNMSSSMTSAMTSMGPLSPEPVATYMTELPSATILSSTMPSSSAPKQNGQKPKGGGHGGHGGHSKGQASMGMTGGQASMGMTGSGIMSGTMTGRMSDSGGHGGAGGGHHHHHHHHHHPRVAYSSNTLGRPGQGPGPAQGPSSQAPKGWDGTETVGRRRAYGPRRGGGGPCTVEQVNELGGSRGHSHSQHFLPTQPYFVTNSKTEVTV